MLSQERAIEIYSLEAERVNMQQDKYGRVLSACANHNIFEPQVSQWIYGRGFRPTWPGGHPFAVCISHDIDVIFKKEQNKPIYFGGFSNVINIAKYELGRRFLNYDKNYVDEDQSPSKVIAINEELGIKSSYYFLSLNKGDQDFNYETTAAELEGIFNIITEQGSEIGLHGGHSAYRDFEKLLIEKENLVKSLGNPLSGYRNHYLRFDTKKTWSFLQKVGFEYDTTLGYADCAGFRNGMCYPFRPFDMVEQKMEDIFEIPLIVMDHSLFAYMEFDKEAIFRILKQFISSIKSVNGVFSLLWHNDKFSGLALDIYTEIIEYLKKEDALFITGKDLITYWKSKEYHIDLEERLFKA